MNYDTMRVEIEKLTDVPGPLGESSEILGVTRAVPALKAPRGAAHNPTIGVSGDRDPTLWRGGDRMTEEHESPAMDETQNLPENEPADTDVEAEETEGETPKDGE